MISTSCVLRIYCFSVSHAPLRLRFSRFDLAMASDRAAHTIVRRSWASATDRARAIGLPKRHSQVLIWNSLLPLVLRAAFGAPSFLSPALACFAENAGHVCGTVFILLPCRKHGIRGTRHRMFLTGTTYMHGTGVGLYKILHMGATNPGFCMGKSSKVEMRARSMVCRKRSALPLRRLATNSLRNMRRSWPYQTVQTVPSHTGRPVSMSKSSGSSR
jgi:hypothetical protein